MNGQSLVAVYESRADAERARDWLMQLGIPATDIRLSLEAGGGTERGVETERRSGGFWDCLFGNDIPEHDRSWYDTHLREGRTAVSVLVRDEAEHGRVAEALEEFDPIDFEQSAALSTAETGMSRVQPMAGSDMADLRAGSVSAGGGSPAAATPTSIGGAIAEGRERDQVIPVVKEELDVGKRATQRRYRIRTYVVERPVEEAVTLRDERVVIEHRPVGGERAVGDAELPQEREYEVVERHEEPVVAKQARKVEDVVVRKEANERTETVRDTVRETRVDVDKEGAERTGNPLDRNR